MFQLLRGLADLRRSVRANTGRATARGSLALRHVDAGSCNGCEHELTAALNPYYDLQQYGLNIVASPRHADLLLVTGAITTAMVQPLRTAYDAMPEPRLVAALGNCPLGINLLGDPAPHAGPLDQLLPVDLRIHGCPPTPEAIVTALTEFLAPPTSPVDHSRSAARAASPVPVSDGSAPRSRWPHASRDSA